MCIRLSSKVNVALLKTLSMRYLVASMVVLVVSGFRCHVSLHARRGTRLFAQKTGWLHAEKSGDGKLPLVSHRIKVPAYAQKLGDGLRSVVTSHSFDVPLSYYNQGGGDPASRIEVHATVVDVLPSSATASECLAFLNAHDLGSELAEAYCKLFKPEKSKSVAFLQGGPGFPSPRPNLSLSFSAGGSSSWASAAMASGYNKFILMDQRGTGQSTPVTLQTLKSRFSEELESSPEVVSDYLANFRADSIVRDCDFIRKTLLSDAAFDAVLGQSYGGFCLATYLTSPSLLPPKSSFFTGGLPPMGITDVAEVYERLWKRVAKRNELYYKTYPGDIRVVKSIVRHLDSSPSPLPSGGFLTVDRFLQLGISLGGGPGAFEQLHELFATAFVSAGGGTDSLQFSTNFLRQVERSQPFDTNPIYALLHESIYVDGPSVGSSRWAAQRALEEHNRADGRFDWRKAIKDDGDDSMVYFYGEMTFPWMFDGCYAELSELKPAAEHLANRDDWGMLYPNKEGGRIRPGQNSGAAAVYYDDFYVDRKLSLDAIKEGSALQFIKPFISNEYQHSGLRDDGSKIFKKLEELGKD